MISALQDTMDTGLDMDTQPDTDIITDTTTMEAICKRKANMEKMPGSITRKNDR